MYNFHSKFTITLDDLFGFERNSKELKMSSINESNKCKLKYLLLLNKLFICHEINQEALLKISSDIKVVSLFLDYKLA